MRSTARRLPVVVLIGVTALTGVACSKKSSGTPKAADATGGKIEVDMTDNAFSPVTITAKAGDRVTLELKNKGTALHNFTIKDADKSAVDVKAGDEDELSFTAPKAGSYAFVCKYHESLGMKGTLTVS
jgi:plastocyanin